MQSFVNASDADEASAAASGCLLPLASLAASSEQRTADQPLIVMRHLVTIHPALASLIVDAGCVAPLVQEMSRSESTTVISAVALLARLADGSGRRSKAIAAAGFWQSLIPLLSSPLEKVAIAAADAIRQLAAHSDPWRSTFVATGCLPPLVALLARRSDAVSKEAAHALSIIAAGDDGHRYALLQAKCLAAAHGMLAKVPLPAINLLRVIAAGNARCNLAVVTSGCMELVTKSVLIDKSWRQSQELQSGTADLLPNLAVGSAECRDAMLKDHCFMSASEMQLRYMPDAVAAGAARALAAFSERRHWLVSGSHCDAFVNLDEWHNGSTTSPSRACRMSCTG